MKAKSAPGLGELLRHLLELTDGSSNNRYIELPFSYRPRYTPLMRVLADGPASVSDLQEKLSVTQGAVSQTIKLMLEDGLITRKKGEDARQSILSLTDHGMAVLKELEPHWEAALSAIKGIEQEIQLPLVSCLRRTAQALERKPFAQRIQESQASAVARNDDRAYNVFNQGSEAYAEFRPGYPPELASALAAISPDNTQALDVGCGNGQLTALLATHFDRVVGIDTSENQLANAEPKDNIEYFQRGAEETGLADHAVDLIVVAQAAHWFDLDKFYVEVRRIAKEGAAIALVSYGVPYIADPVNAVFQQGYWQDVHKYWPPERRHVETGYTELYFPFELLDLPSFDCVKSMTIEQFIGYITTWSAYKHANEAGQQESFVPFFEKLRVSWPQNTPKRVIWPISVRAARLN